MRKIRAASDELIQQRRDVVKVAAGPAGASCIASRCSRARSPWPSVAGHRLRRLWISTCPAGTWRLRVTSGGRGSGGGGWRWGHERPRTARVLAGLPRPSRSWSRATAPTRAGGVFRPVPTLPGGPRRRQHTPLAPDRAL